MEEVSLTRNLGCPAFVVRCLERVSLSDASACTRKLEAVGSPAVVEELNFRQRFASPFLRLGRRLDIFESELEAFDRVSSARSRFLQRVRDSPGVVERCLIAGQGDEYLVSDNADERVPWLQVVVEEGQGQTRH